jgi:hypothetical protein
MTFGASYLTHPDLFPARRGGEAWGERVVTIALPGGPYRFSGLAPAQVEAVRARFGAHLVDEAAGAVETFAFRMAEAECREIDTRGWEYGLDLDSLWTPDAGSESFAGIFENFFRVLTAYRLLEQGGVLVHGAAVVAGGRSLLALGRSGAGKTTFSRLALARGAEVLSDDLNALRRTAAGTVVEKLPFTGDLGDSESPAGAFPLAALLRLEKSPDDGLVPLVPGYRPPPRLLPVHQCRPAPPRDAPGQPGGPAAVRRRSAGLGPALHPGRRLLAYTGKTMPGLDPASILRPARDLRFRRIDDEAVVVRQRAGEVLVMNETAARLLELADGRTSVADWVEVLAGEYEVDREALERDVLAFILDLAEEGMLELVPAAEEESRGV